jgi:hypothetical protein
MSKVGAPSYSNILSWPGRCEGRRRPFLANSMVAALTIRISAAGFCCAGEAVGRRRRSAGEAVVHSRVRL